MVVTGGSGAGKSTLASALVRFIDHRGHYLLGGEDVTELHPESVRSRVLLVEQRPHIFAETLRQNLMFANDKASDEELREVLDTVGLTQWMRTRDGLETHLGEQGELVSGGQAQRIALARALLASPDVLILDEPTAGVDIDTADALMREMLAAAQDDRRAVLVISHVSVPTTDASVINLCALER